MVGIKEKITQTKNYMRRIIRKTRKLLNLITNTDIQLYPDHLRPKQVNPVSNDEVIED